MKYLNKERERKKERERGCFLFCFLFQCFFHCFCRSMLIRRLQLIQIHKLVQNWTLAREITEMSFWDLSVECGANVQLCNCNWCSDRKLEGCVEGRQERPREVG